MNLEQINRLIRQGEGLQVEFKEARNGVPSSFYDTVVSFANTDGGVILLGVNDDRMVTGVDEANIQSYQNDIITTANIPDKINPPILLDPEIFSHPNGNIIVVEILQSKSVHRLQNSILVRRNECDVDITNNQGQVSDLYLRKSGLQTEDTIYPYLTFEGFELSLFDKARNLISSHKSNHPWLTLSNEEMLRSTNLWRHDHQTNKEGYTLAAALLFGKETTIQSINSAYKIDAVVRTQNVDRWDDRLILRKNLIDSYIELNQFINRHLPDKFYLEGVQRVDLRDKIFREVVGNIIVHREYTSRIATEFIITDKSVTAKNPNIPSFHGLINLNSFNPVAKNPNIRKFFMALGWSEEIGSGIRNTTKYLPYYVPNAKPTFMEDEEFTTIIPLVWVTMQKYVSQLIEWLELPQTSLSHIEEGLKDISLPSELDISSWEDILIYLIPSWTHTGKKSNLLRWSLNQSLEKELKKKIPTSREKDINPEQELPVDFKDSVLFLLKKIPSLGEKDTNLLSKRAQVLLKVLLLTTKPIKLQKMLEWLEYSYRAKFNELYIYPLIQIGFLDRTIPDKLNDPEQKYILSEKGRLFLSGQL